MAISGCSSRSGSIATTLVVRLNYSDVFKRDELWKGAADFKTPEGKRVGLAMTKKPEGAAEIVIYFEAETLDDTKVTFIKYVYEHLYERQRDDAEIFTIKKKRQAEYWSSQAYPVMLVIRSFDGKIRWMNITEYLGRPGSDTKQVVFDGEAFTAPNVALMRNRLLGEE